MMDFDARTKKYSNIINNTLNDAFIMTNTPKLLHDAMKYSIDAGGKRIRHVPDARRVRYSGRQQKIRNSARQRH